MICSKMGSGKQCAKYWLDVMEGVCNHGASDSNAQRKKLIRLIQKVNLKYPGKEAIKEQRNGMEFGDKIHWPRPHEHGRTTFEINHDLELPGKEVGKFQCKKWHDESSPTH